jgi:hypothetical protein
VELLSAALVSAASRFGTARFLVMTQHDESGPEQESVLYVWVLNDRLSYTSTFSAQRRAAAKVAFKTMTRREALKLLEPVGLTHHHEINFPQAAISDCVEALVEMNGKLPEDVRKFNELDVSLLARWGRWEEF